MIKDKKFILLFFSRFFSVFGDAFLFITLLNLLEQLKVGSFGLSIFFISATLPAFLFSLFAGAYVENRELQKVMAISDLIRSSLIILFMIAVFYFSNPFIVYLLIFLIATNNMFYLPANSALLPNIVNQEKLSNANGYLQMAMMFAKLGSYGTVAWLIKLNINVSTLLLITASFYLLSMILILNVKPYVKSFGKKENEFNILLDIKEAILYIRNHPSFSRIFLIFGFAWIVGSSIDMFLISYLIDVLNMGSEDLYLFTTFSLIGIAMGSFIAPILYKKIKKKTGMIISSLVFSFVILLYALKLPILLLSIGLLIGGISQGVFLIFINTYLQSNANGQMLARIFSFYNLLLTGASLPGYALFGYLLAKIGTINTGYFISVYLFLISILGILIIPTLEEESPGREIALERDER
ncbi:MFS transporter [Thermicanus aegyptius]|uniref:MFS transporter n=1 Tax=Thermicanus aegyptius TaxID=94009 RepID=UPI000404B4BA|nr:MFS transporter [Thermicanus aegyptius]